jgi:hypothetical protein
MIYVDPKRRITIVKLSANPAFKWAEGEHETLALIGHAPCCYEFYRYFFSQ